MERLKINYDYGLLICFLILLAGYYTRLIPPFFGVPLMIFFACVGALPVLISAAKSLRDKKITIDLLAAIALAVSLIHQQWASAVFINLMLTSARLFANYTSNRSRDAIKSLLKLRPEKVKVKRGRKIIQENISRVAVNDLVIIELGDRVPIDGAIVSGQAFIDQSSLTGESLPINKKVGDKILSSTLCVSGSLVVKTEKVGKDTAFEKIIRLVEQSQKNKIGIQTTADHFATYFIVITLLGIGLVYLFSRDWSLILSVLLVTCADDIAVAIPMAFSAAIGQAANRGIIIKGGSFLEGLTKVKTIVFDKTGTLTRGRIKVLKVIAFHNLKTEEIIKTAAAADFFSEHPIARSIIAYAQEQKITFEKSTDFKEISGQGIKAVYGRHKIFCGRLTFLEASGINIAAPEKKSLQQVKMENSNTLVFVGRDNKLLGVIILGDEIRSDAKVTITALRRLGVKNLIMLTGDNEKTAQHVANALALDKFHANLLPEDKIKYIKQYLHQRYKLAMVGDGVNDAAALALADIGVAMGTIGSDAAIEAADIALMRDDLSKIPEAMALGKKVMGISRQNFLIWGIVNVIGLTLAFSRLIGPAEAAAFNFITDFFPIINALRLFKKQPLKINP